MIFVLFGIIGNIVSIYAFSHRQLIEFKLNWYLLPVTIIRLVFCIIQLIDYIFAKVHNEGIFLHGFNKYSTITIDILVYIPAIPV